MNHDPTDAATACERFIVLIERGDYFEAHETLEAIWFPRRFEGDDEVRLLRGFINAAVAFELRRRGRETAAVKAWKTYLKYRSRLNTYRGAQQAVYARIADTLEHHANFPAF